MDYDARFYDPLLGRFVQADTVVPGIGKSQSFNRYSYVNNNPTNYVDPTGHALCDDMGNCYLRQGESIPTQNQYRFVTNIIRNKLDLSEGKTSTIQSSSQAAVNAYVDNVFNGSNNGSNIANTNTINNDTNISQSIIDPSSVLFWLSMNVN